MYLLDTSVISEIRKIRSGKADPAVMGWVGEVAKDLTYISTITIGELETGTLLVLRRDPASGEVLRSWLDNDVYEAFDHRILSVDAQVARIAAALHVPNPAPVNDALIAATAIAHNLVMVTRNTLHFERFHQLKLLNPWKPATPKL